MGIINNLKEKSKDKAKKEAKKAIKKVISKAFMAVIHTLGPALGIGAAVIIGISLVDWVVEIFTAKNNPELLYETLEIEDVADLITIKGDDTKGYYLDFVDGVDDKLEKIVKKYNKSSEYHNLPKNVDFLKRMLKAEVVTQFPNLKGDIPNDAEDGFQGAISIRRVTPNKSPR